MKRILIWSGQLAVLIAIYHASAWLVRVTGLPIPANVLGIVILFALLCFGIIKLEQVREVAEFLLRHLIFFFIPISVGLMDWGSVFREHGWVLLVAILLSSVVSLYSVGLLAERLRSKKC